MRRHADLDDARVRELIAAGEIRFAGHTGNRIYGRLDCRVGRRYMARVNRVFFAHEAEAVLRGFRPCSVCMKAKYAAWRIAAAGRPVQRSAA